MISAFGQNIYPPGSAFMVTQGRTNLTASEVDFNGSNFTRSPRNMKDRDGVRRNCHTLFQIFKNFLTEGDRVEANGVIEIWSFSFRRLNCFDGIHILSLLFINGKFILLISKPKTVDRVIFYTAYTLFSIRFFL